MANSKLIFFVAITMVAFAGNSLLNRIALLDTAIDPASFTLIRLVSGAVFLLLTSILKQYFSGEGKRKQSNRWSSSLSSCKSWSMAAALFVYAAGFSYAYVNLSAAAGALILFAAVQMTMIGYGFWQGERFSRWQWGGFLFALGGLVILMMPGISAPSIEGAAIMSIAGVAWGVYSVMGRKVSSPIKATQINFMLAVPMGLVLCWIMKAQLTFDASGTAYAVVSGAIASGMGYTLWYRVLPQLQSTTAATIQLSVPVIAAVGGVVVLGESLSLRLVIASLVILSGIAVVLRSKAAN
ncbi:DMT family transporter [Photobacterium minamisatsumaniensis]|uniref:DMT family transporter n=1 Tax=Photobacterium minamisatsumaniensis TaxID=2910233 RepID=UPI003D0BA551